MGEDDTNKPWYRSSLGLVLLGGDLVLVGALVVGTTSVAGDVLRAAGLGTCPPSVTIPGFVYLYALVGATGFVFTKLVRDFERSAGDLARYNLRLPAALPLAAGVYLLSDRLVGSGPESLMAALAFATGLLVNTAYERIRDLAVRLLSPRRDDGDSGGGDEDVDAEGTGDNGEGSEDGSGNEDEDG